MVREFAVRLIKLLFLQCIEARTNLGNGKLLMGQIQPDYFRHRRISLEIIQRSFGIFVSAGRQFTQSLG